MRYNALMKLLVMFMLVTTIIGTESIFDYASLFDNASMDQHIRNTGSTRYSNTQYVKRSLPDVCEESSYQSYDGYCNNLETPHLGISFDVDQTHQGSNYIRVEGHGYELNSLGQYTFPRENINLVDTSVYLMNGIGGNDEIITHNASLFFTYVWQFLIHDMTDNVQVPGDVVNPFTLVRQGTGPNFFNFRVTGFPSNSEIDVDGVPQQRNGATSFLDLHVVYGQNEVVANDLRQGTGGLMKVAASKTQTHKFINHGNFELCDCIDTVTGEPYLDIGVETIEDILRQTTNNARLYVTPEPNQNGKCYSPISDFIGTQGVYSCDPRNPQLLTIDCNVSPLINDPLYRENTVVSDYDLLPTSNQAPEAPIDPTFVPDAAIGVTYVAGDARAIENAGVFLLHVYWLRQHNAKAEELAVEHPDWSDEELYQGARRYCIALWQHLVYDELIPATIGKQAVQASELKKYDGYDSDVDPRINNVFATAAMRWGHSTIPKMLFMRDLETGEKITRTRQQQTPDIHSIDNPTYSDFRFLPVGGQGVDLIESSDWMAYVGGESNLLGGLIHGRGNRVDGSITDGLSEIQSRTCLSPFDFTIDLGLMNDHRGRDNGIKGFTSISEYYTGTITYGTDWCDSSNEYLPVDEVSCFDHMFGVALGYTAQQVYGKITNVGPWTGMLFEAEFDRNKDAMIGKTQSNILVEQMVRTRDGDRFWYQNEDQFDKQLGKDVKSVTFTSFVQQWYSEELPKDILMASAAA